MKKVIVFFLILLVGCSSANIEAEQNKRFNQVYNQDTLMIFQDEETGCRYLIFMDYISNGAGAGGMTPLLKSDGTPDCKN
jgi:uncharacterized protein YceK